MLGRDNLYSSVVSLAKIVMPIVGLGLLSSMFLINETPDQSEAIPYSDIELNEILHQQRLADPKFRGTLDDKSQVYVDAVQAQPDAENKDIIHARVVSAVIEQITGSVITMDAPRGLYNQLVKVVEGFDGVTVTHSEGYVLTTEALRAETEVLDVKADTPVEITGPQIWLRAGQMHLFTKGGPESEHVDFTGGVKVIYTPTKDGER